MLMYSVEFPVSETKAIADLVRIAQTWIQGSPHYRMPEETITAAFSTGSGSSPDGSAQIRVAYAESGDTHLVGIGYTLVEKGELTWKTEVVGAKSAISFRIATRVDCEARGAQVSLPKPKKPYIIRQLFSGLGGGFDGSVHVSDRPILLRESDIEHAASLINGAEGTTLPIVYVSALASGDHVLNPYKLAQWLGGMAHVVVEPSRFFSARLMHEVNRRNAYGGAIAIYWPDGAGRRIYFAHTAGVAPRELALSVSDEIRRALINRRSRPETTWAYLNEAASRQALEHLKQQGSTELDAYARQFDIENTSLKDQLSAAEKEIWRLKAEVHRLESTESTTSNGLVQPGKEIDLFPGDRKGVVMDALRAYLSQALPGSRREHLLKDLVEANDSTSAREEIEAELRAAFSTYRSMDDKTRAQLERVGFTISEDGKHYKAVFAKDGRYTFIIPKTSGDHRAGKNLISDIRRTIL